MEIKPTKVKKNATLKVRVNKEAKEKAKVSTKKAGYKSLSHFVSECIEDVNEVHDTE